MPEAWPASLPQQVLYQGYQEQMADGLLETQPDMGPVQTRRRYSSAARQATVSFKFSTEELAIFRNFRENTVAGGSLPFTFPAQTEDGEWLVKFRKDALPNIAPDGRYWTVNFGIWILP
jgi:hypothetical protein